MGAAPIFFASYGPDIGIYSEQTKVIQHYKTHVY